MLKLNIEFFPSLAQSIPLKQVPPELLPKIVVQTNACSARCVRRENTLNDPQIYHARASRYILMVMLAAFTLAVTSGCKPSGGTHKYETATAARGDIVQHVTASGTLSAVVSVDVGSQVSGKIIALYVDYNSPVKKGQLVAEIDPTIYEASLRQAEGELASAKADVILKQQNLERKKTLVPLFAATQSDLDTATAELAQSEATVIIEQATVESAQANVGYCKITAPVDGIVISRDVDLGQTVAAAMTTPILFTVAQDITKMNIQADVSEADIGQVKDGQTVDFTVDAFPDDVFHGTVTQVRKSPTTTQNVVTYQVIISVDNPEQKLFPGMTADVSILVADHKNALKIPNTALRFTPPDNAIYEGTSPANLQRNERLVYTTSTDGLKLKAVIVKAGITDGVDTEILDGLNEGAPVVTSTLTAEAKSGGFGSPPPQAPQ
jgi:HlyD family secretion protein